MKQRLFFLQVVALVALFVPALSVSAQADPVSILQHFIDSRNQADEAGAMALVAEEISYVAGSGCLLENPCVGTQAIRADVQLFISDHAHSILIGSPSVSGMTVTARAETSNDAVRAAGLDRVVYDYTVDVRDGKLTNLRGVQDASDPQTAAFQAFQRAQQPNTAAVPPLGPAERAAVLNLSLRVHDDWMLPANAATVLNLSPRIHDDWMLPGASSTSSLDLSPRSRDDWMLKLP